MATTQAAAEPELIELSDLADPAAMSFDDPYKDMGSEMLNGVVVVKDSKVRKVFPGKPIRFPVMQKGRLDQIEIEPRVFDPNQS